MSMLYAIVASNWDLTLGYGGVFNFAHVSFFGIGAYATAILAKVIGIPPILAVALGGVFACAGASVLSLAVIRLRGIYVILVTFGFSQLVVQVLVSQADITGGNLGMTFLPNINFAGIMFLNNEKTGYYYLALFVLIASTFFLNWFVRTRAGLALVALRDQENLARARGVSLGQTRLIAMNASAAFTGIAGGVFALYLRIADPSIFGFDTLALVLSMLLVGGTGTIWGPIVGSFILTFVSEALVDIGAWRHVFVAVLIIAVLLRFSGGFYAILANIGQRLSTRRTE